MGKVLKAMKERNLKYFSSLTPSQKNKTYSFIRIQKNKLGEIPEGLAKEILKSRSLDEIIKENVFIDEKIKGQKMFYYSKLKLWVPLNITQILNT